MSTFLLSEIRRNSTRKTKKIYDSNEIENEFKIKSLYLAKSAHELKNVFLTISSFIENKEDSILSDLKSDKEKKIKEEYSFLKCICDFGMSLIYEITQISKNDGKFMSIKPYNDNEKIEYEEFNLYNALNFCVKMFQSRAKFEKKNIEIKLNLNNISYDKKIKSIPEMRLKQVIINLISNSYKFTINGTIELSVEKINNVIRVKISDTGIGFNQDDIGKIFQPFQMIEENQFLNKNGSGLGLFICREILSSNDIELKFTSQKGKGSQFYFDVKDLENIFDPSIILNEGLKSIMNEINTGQKDLNPYFKTEYTNTIFVDDEDEIIDDDENESIQSLNNNSFRYNFNNKNNIFRKVQSSNTLPKNKLFHFRMDSNKNYTSKTIIKSLNHSKKNILVVKSLININIGKGLVVRSLSQKDLDKKEKNLLFTNSNKNIRILICDDDSLSALSIRKLIIKYFEKKNETLPDIFYVPNGIECLYTSYTFLIEDNPIDIIIMDMNMPFLNGFVTCKLLKNILEMNDIKIYLQSSQNVNISDCDADGFFDKPLSMINLEEIFLKKMFNK